MTAAVLWYRPGCTISYMGRTITIPSSFAMLWNRFVVGPSGIGSV